MSTTDLLVDAIARIVEQHGTSPVTGGCADDAWSRRAWEAFAALGYPWISIAVERGGSGGSVADLLTVLIETSRGGVSLPIAETGLLAGWLLAAAARPLPDGPATAIPPDSATHLRFASESGNVVVDGVAPLVPWARAAEQLLLICPPGIVATSDGASFMLCLRPSQVDIRPRRNLAGEPRDDVIFEHLSIPSEELVALPDASAEVMLSCRGAIGRAACLVGAMLQVRSMTVEHARARRQFGRPIARFQAVAQSLAIIAEHTEVARVAVESAGLLLDDAPLQAAASCKIAAGNAASIVAARAHQVHGAIGLTQEHDLHRFTRGLYAWSAEYGTETEWSTRLGELAIAASGSRLWPFLTGTRRVEHEESAVSTEGCG